MHYLTDKVQLLLWINSETNMKFRKLIQKKYPMYEKGILSREGESALSYWLSLHTGTQKEEIYEALKPITKIKLHYLNLKRYLLSKYFDELIPGTTIHRRFLVEAIQNTRGSDERTIVKWLKIFINNGMIREVNATLWELII